MTDPHREFCRRHQRIIAHYLALVAWIRGLDCIVLERSVLRQLLGLRQFKSTRVEWLMEDMSSWFAFIEAFYSTRAKSSIHSLWLSRIDLSDLPKGSLSTLNRIEFASENGLRAGVFANHAREVSRLEEMVGHLALLADGLATPMERCSIRIRKQRKRR